MAVTFTDITIDTTAAVKKDQQAAKRLVIDYNNWREAQEPPLPALPTEPNPDLFASYQQSLLEWTLPNAHNSWGDQGESFSGEVVGDAYIEADETTQDQVEALLGL